MVCLIGFIIGAGFGLAGVAMWNSGCAILTNSSVTMGSHAEKVTREEQNVGRILTFVGGSILVARLVLRMMPCTPDAVGFSFP